MQFIDTAAKKQVYYFTGQYIPRLYLNPTP